MSARRLTLTIFVLLLVMCATAGAQDYSFSVPEMVLEVVPHADASATFKYTILFQNNAGAHPINVVDIGLPHRGYDIENMSATLNGETVYNISRSTYIDVGVEVPLVPQIEPGESGLVTFEATMPDMVYQDTTDPELASLRFTPTWWGSQYVTGTTELIIGVYLPDEIDLDRVVWQLGQEFQKVQLDDRKAVVWVFPETRVVEEHMVGVSFPKAWMERVVEMTAFGLAYKWWEESPNVRLIAGALMVVLFAVWFFRFTGGTGGCLFTPLIIVIPIAWGVSPALQLISIPVLILLLVFSERMIKAKRRTYLPPIESVAGGEIKRGLTAPEAAVILERPLGEVLTLVIFGLLSKGLVVMKEEDPLTVEVPEHFQTTRGERRKIAAELGTVIRGYEQPFLDSFMAEPGRPVPDLDLSKEMKNLITNVVDRMKGFDLERTKEYYESIVYRAWKEAQKVGEVEKRDEYVDHNIGWLMLAPPPRRRFHVWHSAGRGYTPRWAGGATASASGPEVGGRTSAGDVAASFSGWAERVSGRMASSMDPVSVGVRSGGVMNLSGVDKVGMDFLNSMAESNGSSGGGGGCACACAGCACACACAGGGR